jgi:hypothetical protein
MMSQSIINTGKVLRQIVIGQLQDVSEAQFDIQPEGFNNTIRWNVGHMVYWMDKYSTLSFGSPSAIPAQYEALFSSGTKPSDWTIAPIKGRADPIVSGTTFPSLRADARIAGQESEIAV